MSDGGRSGLSLWAAGLLGFLAYRRGKRSAAREPGGGPAAGSGRAGRRGDRGHWGGGPDGRGPMRDVRLPDGREALQVTASLFAPEEGGTEEWRRVVVERTSACQTELEATLAEVAPGARTAEDVPVLLMPLGTRRRVNVVDVYATGGLIGSLPEYAVRAVGDAIRATHLAEDRPCAVMSRIAPDPSGLLGVEVLMPETFRPGRA